MTETPHVKVVIPWRPEPTRQAACDWLVEYYRHRFGADSVVLASDGGAPGEPFNKSRAINRAIDRRPDQVCVISDADVVICDWSLRKAIECAAAGRRLYLPHNRFCRMTEQQSRWFLQLPPSHRVSGRMFRRQRRRAAPGGLWVIRADLFSRHRMDERFRGWGAEDTDFISRTPRIRFAGPMFHIWHPKADKSRLRINRRIAAASRRQRRRYRDQSDGVQYRGVAMQQHSEALAALHWFVDEWQPERILEIGTAAGGLTLALHDMLPEVPIRTYDIRRPSGWAKFRSPAIDWRVADWRADRESIEQYVTAPGRSMIICDGGDKPAEVRAMAAIAKPGDMILAHDWAKDRDYFRDHLQGQRWNWCEITAASIADVKNLQYLGIEDLERVAWMASVVR